MKIIILSLLAIGLIICILYYEHSQVVRKISDAKTEKFNADVENGLVDAYSQETIDNMNNGGENTISSNICDRKTSMISSLPKTMMSFNLLFKRLNFAFDEMYKNFDTYIQYKESVETP